MEQINHHWIWCIQAEITFQKAWFKLSAYSSDALLINNSIIEFIFLKTLLKT
ncbi:hypothetical protein CSC2_41100 [Clostridium zeae]|uniref:Uncharacterized protein n=1 Tax=Clostridium zeae TaxID=2759022 RepID=A0ABQ1EG02_9CLOT|nr:hypothetical protein CSC2_41100 [Clostridium zeae]